MTAPDIGDDDLPYLSATRAAELFRSRDLSPVELMRATIARAEATEPAVNAFTATHFERALEQAARAEARFANPKGRPRSLEGLPVAIKDEQSIAGEVTTQGSLIHANDVGTVTEPTVERIRRAGGIIHARTATPEFCCAAFCWSRLWGVTRNPWNLEYTPGGSSGGSGAALAAGTTALATGSDIGGSIRIPASACGVVGFKPPYGRNPQLAPFNLDWYCHVGPMARTVADCALLQNVMVGPHPLDTVSLRPKVRIPARLDGIEGWRIAYSIDLGFFEVDEEVRANTLAAVEALRDLGAVVEEVDLGWDHSMADAMWAHFGAIFGPTVAAEVAAHPDEVTDYARAFAERTADVSAADVLASLQTEGRMYATLGPLLQKYDVLVCPTLAVPSVGAEHDVRDTSFTINGRPVGPYIDWCMTYPFNLLARCPVLAVPSGSSASAVPTGIQIVGRTYDDASVFRAGKALESVRPWFGTPADRPALRGV